MTSVLGSFLFVFASLLPIVNPLGGAMLFLSMTPDIDSPTRADLARRIALYSFIVLVVSLYAGALVLSFFGISLGVLRVAGGLVLVAAGWHALNAPRESNGAAAAAQAARVNVRKMAFFPLTMPLTTGPGAISVATAIGTSSPRNLSDIVGALLAAAAITVAVWVCYRYSDRINRAVGETGADALSRVFAFILICVGVQVLWTGFVELWMDLPARA